MWTVKATVCLIRDKYYSILNLVSTPKNVINFPIKSFTLLALKKMQTIRIQHTIDSLLDYLICILSFVVKSSCKYSSKTCQVTCIQKFVSIVWDLWRVKIWHKVDDDQESLTECDFLSFFNNWFLKFEYGWYTMLHSFRVYNLVTWQVDILYYAPYSIATICPIAAVTISFTVFSMLSFVFIPVTYQSITGTLYCPLPFTQFAHLWSPSPLATISLVSIFP